MKAQGSKKKVFIAYSRNDAELLTRLRVHLKALERNNLIEIWSDNEIEVGKNWDNEIKSNLSNSDIILLLISADFIASDYCYEEEMKRALQMHEKKNSVVVPIILRECSWKLTPFAKFQVLPEDGVPITHSHWGSIDRSLHNVTQELISLINRLNKEATKKEPEAKPNSNSTSSSNKKEKPPTNSKNESTSSKASNSNEVNIRMKLSYEEIYLGVTKKIKYKRRERCSACEGQPSTNICYKCNGAKYLLQETITELEIPPGVEEGMTLSMKGHGNQIINKGNAKGFWKGFISNAQEEFGDLLVYIEEKKHPFYTREGANLIYTCEVSATEISSGIVKEIPLPDNSTIKIQIPPGTENGKVFRIRNKGFTVVRDKSNGDLLISVKVK